MTTPTHDDFIRIEDTVDRTRRALTQLDCNQDTKRSLEQACYILAEIRFAARFLCDESIGQEAHQQSVERLLEIFTATNLAKAQQ